MGLIVRYAILNALLVLARTKMSAQRVQWALISVFQILVVKIVKMELTKME